MTYTFPIAFLLCLGGIAAEAHAQSLSRSVTLATWVQPMARLTLSSNSINFPDADPDLVPLIPASGGPITVTAKARGTRNAVVILTMQASDNLRSGVNVLPVSLITWTSTGAGFVGGTASQTTAQTVGSWTGSGVRVGNQLFRFQNSWFHPPGIYTVSLVYTLTAP
jgi:hypothetical protein